LSAPPHSHLAQLPERLRLPPAWTLALALAAACAVVAWQLAGAHPEHGPVPVLRMLAWPGLAVFLAVYAFAWLGWALDID
jgi:hypothetical protein